MSQKRAIVFLSCRAIIQGVVEPSTTYNSFLLSKRRQFVQHPQWSFYFCKKSDEMFFIVSVTQRRKFDIVYVIFVLGLVSCANGARAVKHDIRMYNTCLREFFDINNTSTNIRDANKTFIMKCTQISEQQMKLISVVYTTVT